MVAGLTAEAAIKESSVKRSSDDKARMRIVMDDGLDVRRLDCATILNRHIATSDPSGECAIVSPTFSGSDERRTAMSEWRFIRVTIRISSYYAVNSFTTRSTRWPLVGD